MARSTVFLRGIRFPPRKPSFAVTTMRQRASRIRSRRDSALNPPKTTEWTAPMRAQASIVKASSGIIGKYRQTRSPLRTPWARSTLAMRQTLCFSSR
jgi:hypothetical protein